jgi:protein TonB
MERPNHLNTGTQSASSRVTGIVIVVAIHVFAILGLITALASDRILQQIKDIKASVDAEKTPPKPPPPPPVDFVPPPPQTAIIPEFTTTVEAPPPITVVKQAPPPPVVVARAAPPPTELHAIARTHTLPPYPTISQRLGEQGTSLLEVSINPEGNVTECKIAKSSGSERLDNAACDFVKARWRWQPPTTEGKPTAATTRVSVVWNLKDAQ